MQSPKMLQPTSKDGKKNLIALCLSLGYSDATEIKDFLDKKHNLRLDLKEVESMLKEFSSDQYNHTWLESLLDLHYPKIYEYVIKELNEGVSRLDVIADSDQWNKNLRLQALIARNNLLEKLLSVLHKGVVVREMRKIAIQAKQTARDVTKMQLEKSPILVDTTQLDIIPEIIEMDINLNKIETPDTNDSE